ncbi:E3 ubiquitin-protein ligase RNFT1-like isoform X3 [Styela clava]
MNIFMLSYILTLSHYGNDILNENCSCYLASGFWDFNFQEGMSAEEAKTSIKEPAAESSDQQPHDCEECEIKMDETDNKSFWEAQKSLLWQSLPLLVLILISIILENVISILLFVALISTFDTINDFIVKQSSRPKKIAKVKALLLSVYLIGCICLSFPIIRKHWLIRMIHFYSWWRDHGSFWSGLYLVTIMDFLFKYFTMFIKCLILLLSGKVITGQKRGKIYMAVEGVSQIFRCFLPIPEWSKYILRYHFGFSSVISWIIFIIYVIMKLKTVKNKIFPLISVLRQRTVTGTELQPASADDISALPDARLCPICQDPFIEPVKLPCEHIYCMDCISIWFDREQHCPFCASYSINSVILGLQSAITPLAQYTSSNRKWKTGTTDYLIQFF